jgi:predicted acylesterase/phospholipase RssA
MGAVIGGAMTIYEKNEDLMQLALRYADPRRIFDSTLPFTSLMASHKVTRILQEIFGDRLLEDQWLPFFCVASNLTTAVSITYQRGSMWQAIRASIAIPGVLTPVIHNGHIIVDGGVIDNFPVETMASLCDSERIIGVNVTALEEKREIYDFEYSISGWRIFLSRLNPFRPALRVPSLVSTILRTFEINSVRRAQEAEALVDLMIRPDVKKFATTAYDECADIVQVGYETALEPLRVWGETRDADRS